MLTPFLRSLVERGLDLSQGVLVILDGGKGLRTAVRKAFRGRALVQRCQWHKRENVVSYLAKHEQAVWRQRLQRAYNRPDYDEALGALERLHGNQSADSLAEGLDETLTLPHALVEERCAKVDRRARANATAGWRPPSWTDRTAPTKAVRGYRHLPMLRAALKRELKIDTTTSKKQAA